MNNQNTFITKEGLAKIKKELNDLKDVKRRDIAERIREAKELGDLSENAEYTEAKNDQSFIEGRILEIESILKSATIIKEASSKGQIEVGSKIKIQDGKETKSYFIVGSNEADPAQGKISNESPLGQAFLGKKKGDIVEIKVPQGTKKFEIIAII
ncbi:transcription elongation factor GreA [Patescibacteria group bacterium]|nr:transcription elongation factor GreA [Patescibacteria group bacterium]